MDRIQQPRVDQGSRDFANLQQNDAFDAQAGSPQYVQHTQHMYTPHPLDRSAQGGSMSGAASASEKPTAGPALYPAAIHHASSSMADNRPLLPMAYQSQMFQAFGAALQNIHSAAWNGSPLQDHSNAAAPVPPWMPPQQQSQSMAPLMLAQQYSQPQQYSQRQQQDHPAAVPMLNHSAATFSSQSDGVDVADAQPKAVKGKGKTTLNPKTLNPTYTRRTFQCDATWQDCCKTQGDLAHHLVFLGIM